MTTQGNGQPSSFRVSMSAQTRAVVKELHRQSMEKGIGKQFVSAYREIIKRLARDPKNFGEPLYRLEKLKLMVYQAAIAPILVDFAVHEEQPLVLIRGFKSLG